MYRRARPPISRGRELQLFTHVEDLSGHITSFPQINDSLDNIFCIRKHSNSLAKPQRKSLHTSIEELDLKSSAFHLIYLPDELVQTILSNLAHALRSGVHSMIDTRRYAVRCHLKANRFTILRWAQHHM